MTSSIRYSQEMWCSTVSKDNGTINKRLNYLGRSTQPGLWAHSHDAESDLLKRYVIAKQMPVGRLWLSSYADFGDALSALPAWSENETYYILDQFNNNKELLTDSHND